MESNPSTLATQDAPIVICDEWGDLYVVQPGFGAHRIESEDDLDDLDRIRAMPMFMSVLRMLETHGGRRWRRIVFEPCDECDGTGLSGDYTDEPEWERDEDGRSYLTSHRVHHDCETCAGQHVRPRWAGEIDRRAVLGEDAA